MGFEIREIDDRDRVKVTRFLESTWGTTMMASHGVLIDASRLPGIGVFDGSGLVGLLTYNLKDRVCEVVTINSLRQGEGIGTELINRVVGLVQGLDLSRIFLVTTNDNIDAIRFYQKRGWCLAGINRGAIDEARASIKPEIPKIGNYSIPIRDELIFELPLGGE